jgi:thymidylate kinase
VTVVCDRYIHTTQAYHAARGVKIVDDGTLALIRPDHAFYITINDEGVRRTRITGRGRLEPGDEQARGQGGLLDMVERYFSTANLIPIDNGDRPFEATLDELMAHLEK